MKVTIGPDGNLTGLKEFIEALVRSKQAAAKSDGVSGRPWPQTPCANNKVSKAHSLSKRASK